jgi:hypothetical protein
VSLTAFSFFAAAAAAVVVTIDATVTVAVAIAVVVICCHLHRHPHTRMIVNLVASFPLRRNNDIMQQRAKGIDGRQWEEMRSNWRNINAAQNKERKRLAEEPQAP